VCDLSPLGIDAVYVTTLPSSHYPVVRELFSLEIARNIFVEKSLAASLEEAEEMCRLADTHGGECMVGFQKRFGRTFNKTKRLLDEGFLGEIVSFEAYAYSSDFAEAKGDTGQSRGGVLRDQGSHAIDLAHWFFGDLEVVRQTERDSPEGPEDLTFGKVEAAGGVQGTFTVSAQMPDYRLPEIGMAIVGSEGTIKVNDDRVEVESRRHCARWHRQDLDDSSVPFLLADPEYSRESQAFIAAAGGRHNHGGADFQAGARVEKVIDAILNSQLRLSQP